jgi:hypothetical protein
MVANAECRQMDHTIVFWIVDTIYEALQDVIMEANITAYSIWSRLHSYFDDNQEG